MTSVAIILVNWNSKKDTLACLNSLAVISHQSSVVSTIVVDNGSTDDSVVAIKKNFPEVVVIEVGENLGFAGGNNVGIRKALEDGADVVWLLNNDTTVERQALNALIEGCTNTSVGIAGSKIYFTAGHEFHRERYQKKELGKVLWYAGGRIDWKNMYAFHRGVDEVDHGQYDTMEETPFITGCSMMVKRQVFEKIGLFDEKFFAYLEDVDLCLRAKRMGYALCYVPQSKLWHNNAGSSGSGSQTHQYYMTRNRLLVGMRYASIRTKLALLKEAIRFTLFGPFINRKAIIDAMLGRWGRV